MVFPISLVVDQELDLGQLVFLPDHSYVMAVALRLDCCGCGGNTNVVILTLADYSRIAGALRGGALQKSGISIILSIIFVSLASPRAQSLLVQQVPGFAKLDWTKKKLLCRLPFPHSPCSISDCIHTVSNDFWWRAEHGTKRNIK
jgi:hypothetical protein